MTLRLCWVVLRKELVDGLRDRRALLSALVFPLLGPALIALMMNVIAEDKNTQDLLEIPVAGAEFAPSLAEFLTGAGALLVDPPEDPEARVKAGEVPLVVVVPPDFLERVRAGETASVEMIVDRSRNAALADIQRAEHLLEAW